MKKKIQDINVKYFNDEEVKSIASEDINEVYQKINSNENGLSKEEILESQSIYGYNEITSHDGDSFLKLAYHAFINPFTIILLILMVVSLFTDIILASNGEKDYTAVIIIALMVIISGTLRLIQEQRSGNAAASLVKLVTNTANVIRKEEQGEMPFDEIVVGDIIQLSAGDMIPADMRLIQAKDLFVSQSSLTGESHPIEKFDKLINENYEQLFDLDNIVCTGSNVLSGSARGVVINIGNNTIFGGIARDLKPEKEETSFEKGVNSVSWVLIRFMMVMLPFVFVLNGVTKQDWFGAFLFAISIAVGLTPEMLPMIVSACLAKGSVSMSKEKTIVKNLNSIQNLGAIDILCTDKTGTITQDKVVLEYPLNISGQEDLRVLRFAYLNSYFQTGLKNLMDVAIINRGQKEAKVDEELQTTFDSYEKLDEIPFDFNRRRMSVVVRNANNETIMITKGAIEEMISVSSFVEEDNEIKSLDDNLKASIINRVQELNEDGLRVIGVARKVSDSDKEVFGVADEMEMVLIGYLAFLDPPKDSAQSAIKALADHGVVTKILTGDNDKVTKKVCEQIGIEVGHIYLGHEISKMSDEELQEIALHCNIFAKVSPQQKARIIRVLQESGSVVGFMGDGINDAIALQKADVGISVDTAVDIAKESADVILLEKDLNVLEKGIIEGRKTYANMMKYIKMTASSNFGNVFSVLIASAFLPFLPMLAIHLLLLNLIYDISCVAIPWDNVDVEYLKNPRQWDSSSVGRFMVWFGPTSSIFDIITYLVLYFIVAPGVVGLNYHQISDLEVQATFVAIFQAGWFIQSMWTQTLVIHMIRTPKLPFIQSHASFMLTTLTFLAIALLTIIPFTGFGHSIGFASLPMSYFGWLLLIVLGYIIVVSLVKKIYIKKYNELL